MINQTLRALAELPLEPAGLADSTLILIDCQNTYTTGETVPAAAIQSASLAGMADLFAVVVPGGSGIPD